MEKTWFHGEEVGRWDDEAPPGANTVEKSWGHEKIHVNFKKDHYVEFYDDYIHHETGYCGKTLCIKEGCGISWQRHTEKTETFLVQNGACRLIWMDGNETNRLKKEGCTDQEIYRLAGRRILLPGHTFHIPAGTLHRLEAIVDSEIIEFSTPHDDNDIERIPVSYE